MHDSKDTICLTRQPQQVDILKATHTLSFMPSLVVVAFLVCDKAFLLARELMITTHNEVTSTTACLFLVVSSCKDHEICMCQHYAL